MKNKLLHVIALTVSLIFVFTIGALAVSVENDNTQISVPSGYKYVTQSTIDENLQLINEINFSRDDFEKYLFDNKIILFAYNGDNKNEIIVKQEKDVWESTFDIDLLSEESLEKIAPKLTADLEYEKMTLGDYVFLRTSVSGNDKGGAFNVVRYVTIQNGDLISVEFMFSGDFSATNTKFSESVMGTFYTPKGTSSAKNSKDIANDVAIKCLIIFAIIAGVGVAIYIIITIVIDIRKKRNTSDVAPYVKIKRRKF